MTFVRETSEGWEVVEGEKRVAGPFASQVEALDEALARNGGRTKDAILRDPDTKNLNGEWRWLHATDVEDVPAYDGARIDETTVTQAVENLNAQGIPRPINGGSSDSPGHGDAGQTLANGYAHHAIEVVAADGRHGAYVIAELVPDVARNIDAGRIAYTSIGLGGTTSEDDDAIRDAFFDHLALTNTPAVTTLKPSAAIRKSGEQFVALRSSRLARALGPNRKGPAMKTTIRKELAKLSLRGAALDALTKLCATLNISMDDEMSSEEWESPAVAAVRAVRTLAAAEKTLEAINGASPAVRSHARNVVAVRAEVADADLEALAKAVGLEAGAAMADIIKAIEAMKPAKAPEGDAAKSDAAAVRAELAVLRSEQASDRAELANLRAKDTATENAAWLDEQVKAKGIALRAEDRSTLLGVLTELPGAKGRDLVTGTLATRSAPPTGTVIKNDGNVSDPLAAGSNGAAIAKRAAEMLPALRTQFPGEPEHLLVARAQKAASA